VSQLLALSKELPIQIGTQFDMEIPATYDELMYLAIKLDRLVADEEDGEREVTNADLRTMFMQLSDHYYNIGEDAYENEEEIVDDNMPFLVGDLKKIYDSLVKLDDWKGDSRTYAGDQSASVGTIEMSNLFDELAKHYGEPGNEKMG